MANAAAFRYRALIHNGRDSELFESNEEYGVGDVIQLASGSVWRIYAIGIDDDSVCVLHCAPIGAVLKLVES